MRRDRPKLEPDDERRGPGDRSGPGQAPGPDESTELDAPTESHAPTVPVEPTVPTDTDEDDEGEWAPEVVSIPIDGELDLHTFAPAEVRELVPDYIDECLAQGITDLRIVHGKGRGTLRRIVHAALERHPAVDHYELAGAEAGGWGATLVKLKTP